MHVAAMRAAALALPAVLLLAGCLGDAWGDCGAGTPTATLATPRVEGAYMQTADWAPWETVVLVSALDATEAPRVEWSAAPGWNVTAGPLAANATHAFQLVKLVPGEGPGHVRATFEARNRDGGCATTQGGSLQWDLAESAEGRLASPGQGVHVMTAGFLEDGTLFYTNIPEVDADPRWPRVAWYEWGGDAPLPVYVYDQDRAEQPPHWKGAAGLVAQVPRGSPADAAIPVAGQAAGTADGQAGLGYFTTIPGFNAGLKQSPTTTTRVVHLAPEEGYTRPGNEAHDLYGLPLVFYIKVLAVVDAPCPATAPAWTCPGMEGAVPAGPGLPGPHHG